MLTAVVAVKFAPVTFELAAKLTALTLLDAVKFAVTQYFLLT